MGGTEFIYAIGKINHTIIASLFQAGGLNEILRNALQ